VIFKKIERLPLLLKKQLNNYQSMGGLYSPRISKISVLEGSGAQVGSFDVKKAEAKNLVLLSL
jgi:hypothetical protein